MFRAISTFVFTAVLFSAVYTHKVLAEDGSACEDNFHPFPFRTIQDQEGREKLKSDILEFAVDQKSRNSWEESITLSGLEEGALVFGYQTFTKNGFSITESFYGNIASLDHDNKTFTINDPFGRSKTIHIERAKYIIAKEDEVKASGPVLRYPLIVGHIIETDYAAIVRFIKLSGADITTNPSQPRQAPYHENHIHKLFPSDEASSSLNLYKTLESGHYLLADRIEKPMAARDFLARQYYQGQKLVLCFKEGENYYYTAGNIKTVDSTGFTIIVIETNSETKTKVETEVFVAFETIETALLVYVDEATKKFWSTLKYFRPPPTFSDSEFENFFAELKNHKKWKVVTGYFREGSIRENRSYAFLVNSADPKLPRVLAGTVVEITEEEYVVQTDPFNPATTIKLPKFDVKGYAFRRRKPIF